MHVSYFSLFFNDSNSKCTQSFLRSLKFELCRGRLDIVFCVNDFVHTNHLKLYTKIYIVHGVVTVHRPE